MIVNTQTLVKAAASRWMFVVTTAIFVAETSWLAITSRFPMPYDEGYHFGIIRFFSGRLDPIVNVQPGATYPLGGIVHNPSFLYHYLLSFPARSVWSLTHDLTAEVVALRFVNIMMAVATLLVLRRLLRTLRLPGALANLIILIFALTPAMTVLSAEINYDNLLILLTTACLYQMTRQYEKLARVVFDTRGMLMLLGTCIYASLVKFAFLPVFLGVIIVMSYKMTRAWQKDKSRLLKSAKETFSQTGRITKLIIATAIVAGSLLFVRFYGVNMITYHTPVPQCDQVLSTDSCRRYYAWESNQEVYRHRDLRTGNLAADSAHYSLRWLFVNGLFLIGAVGPGLGLFYVSLPYLIIVSILATGGLVAAIINRRAILRNHGALVAVLAVSAVYVSILWARNYSDHLHLGRSVAVNGRYLLPILVYCYALMGLGFHYGTRGAGRFTTATRMALIASVTLVFLCYGGFSQYVWRVDPRVGRLSDSTCPVSIRTTLYEPGCLKY